MTIARLVRRNEFVRHNAIYFIAALAVGALNYLYYPVLGRLMDPAPFGEVQTLVSLFLQVTAYLLVMGLITIHIVANRSNTREANKIVGELEKLALLIGGVLLLATIIANGLLKDFFHFESGLPFILLSLAVVITVPYTFRSAYVNGKKFFGLNAWSSVTAAGGKLVFSSLLVVAGFGTVGALFGIVLAQIVALGLAAYFAHRHGFTESLKRLMSSLPNMKLIAPELRYALLVLVGSLSITILYSADVVVVKHYFDPHTAGLYASVAIIARGLFFLTMSISQVLMPSVRIAAPVDENRRILMKSFLLLCVLGGAVLAVFAAAPNQVITLLMGDTYRTYANLLPRLALAVFVIAILNLFMMYYIALRQYAVGVIGIAGVGITSSLMIASHESLEGVVNSMLYGSLAMAVIFAFWMGWNSQVILTKEGGELGARAHINHRSGV